MYIYCSFLALQKSSFDVQRTVSNRLIESMCGELQAINYCGDTPRYSTICHRRRRTAGRGINKNVLEEEWGRGSGLVCQY